MTAFVEIGDVPSGEGLADVVPHATRDDNSASPARVRRTVRQDRCIMSLGRVIIDVGSPVGTASCFGDERTQSCAPGRSVRVQASKGPDPWLVTAWSSRVLDESQGEHAAKRSLFGRSVALWSVMGFTVRHRVPVTMHHSAAWEDGAGLAGYPERRVQSSCSDPECGVGERRLGWVESGVG